MLRRCPVNLGAKTATTDLQDSAYTGMTVGTIIGRRR
jgi:hypothetical protein